MELHSARRYGMGGPERITYVDVKAWSELMERRVYAHEVEALMQIDIAWLAPGTPEEDS